MHILSMSIFIYLIDDNAIKAHKINSNREGKCFLKVLFTLKWKYWALSIKLAISREGIRTKEECHIPTISKVANDVFENPTKFRVTSLNLNKSNSLRTLWNLKIQTYATDIATAICAKYTMFSILFIFFWIEIDFPAYPNYFFKLGTKIKFS